MNKLSSFITHQTFIDFIIRFIAKKGNKFKSNVI